MSSTVINTIINTIYKSLYQRYISISISYNDSFMYILVSWTHDIDYVIDNIGNNMMLLNELWIYGGVVSNNN